MNTIIGDYKQYTFEEYVKHKLCKSDGVASLVQKKDLLILCKYAHLNGDKNMTKAQLFDLLITSGYTHEDLATLFRVGVSNRCYREKFKLTYDDVNYLGKCGLLRISGFSRYHAYGRTIRAPQYDVVQYVNMTDSEMNTLLQKLKSKKVTFEPWEVL